MEDIQVLLKYYIMWVRAGDTTLKNQIAPSVLDEVKQGTQILQMMFTQLSLCHGRYIIGLEQKGQRPACKILQTHQPHW